MSGPLPGRALLVLCLSLSYASLCRADTTTIHAVLDGVGVSGADIFVDGRHRGKTNGQGALGVDRALLTDNKTVITARLQVHEVPAFLPGHEDAVSPAGWVMRAYVTSVVIEDTGAVKSFVVADKTAQQELVLKRDNVLIGLQLLASVDWDMSKSDFTRLMETFQVASRFLWNATDGQFIFEQVKIADQAQAWDRSEYRLCADNTPRPRATMGGYLVQNAVGALVGSYVTLPWRDSRIHIQGPNGGWSGADPRTFVHEFGHLGFALQDEYSDVVADTCTPKRTSDADRTPFGPRGEKAACIMDNQFTSNKFCSDHGENSHNYTSLQPDDCWAGIRGGYSDPDGARWILKTPVTRAQIVGSLLGASGTARDAFPLEWNTSFVVSNNGWNADLCRPFLQPVTYADGSPAPAAPVKLLYTTTDPSQRTWISEGKTFGNGEIAILGAHQGDTVMTQTAFNVLTTCPMGTWPQGPLGTSSNDSDVDRVPDAFDTCPNLFNPYDLDNTWVGQNAACACAKSGGTGPQCTPSTCVNDADCGAGRKCQINGIHAVCVGNIEIGTNCSASPQCRSGHCDVGNGSSKTGLCVPGNLEGQPGAVCSHDNQCVFANCSGLAPNQAGGWQPGKCGASATKPLGDYCFGHAQCDSGYCDIDFGTSRTNRCMPNRNGQIGQICSNDNQCASLNCSGLVDLSAAVPGTCGSKKGLGVVCSAHGQCNSTRCDSGWGSSNTYRCMPNGNGVSGNICSHDNQCTPPLVCSGLHQGPNGWAPGACGSSQKLGTPCASHAECASNYCDSGDNTSHTGRCMPNKTGVTGDVCSHDNQCAPPLACSGLHQDTASNKWVPGACGSSRALGQPCASNAGCASNYCDSGNNTSHTGLCMPNNDGVPGDICSAHHQCASMNCGGVTKNGNRWVPGQCL